MKKQQERLNLPKELIEDRNFMRPIEGYEGLYSSVRIGEIYSHRNDIYLSQTTKGDGYKIVNLHKDGKQKTCRVNVLIAEAFIEKPDWWAPGMAKLDVAHLDNDRGNNVLSNLSWKTRAENLDTDHFRERNKIRRRTPIKCVETGKVYVSQAEAAREIGIHKYGINNVLMGKQNTAGGYHWERVEDVKI